MEIQRIALAAFSAGAVVLFGACYAVFLALSRLHRIAMLNLLSNLSYAALATAVVLKAYNHTARENSA